MTHDAISRPARYTPDNLCWDCEGEGVREIDCSYGAVVGSITTECFACNGTGIDPNYMPEEVLAPVVRVSPTSIAA